MKMFFRCILGLVLFNFISGIGVIGYLGYSLIAPTLEETGISFTRILKDDLTQKEFDLFSKQLSENASSLGVETGKSIVSTLKQLFPEPNFNFADVPSVEYPYPSLNVIVEQNNNSADAGIKEALDSMNQYEQDIQQARTEGINILRDADIKNKAAKEQSLLGGD